MEGAVGFNRLPLATMWRQLQRNNNGGKTNEEVLGSCRQKEGGLDENSSRREDVLDCYRLSSCIC